MNPFGICKEDLAKMYPDLVIAHLTNRKNNRIGYVKTENVEIIIVETKTHEKTRQYEFLTIEGKVISVLTAKKSCDISFYTRDNKELLVDCDTPVYFINGENGISQIKLTGFKTNLFGIPRVYEYCKHLHYYDIVINNYKTYVVEINSIFYRIFYNAENFLMFKHKVANFRLNPIYDVKQVYVEEELRHLFVDMTKEQFIDLCELIELTEFTNLPDALTYIGHLKKVDKLDMEKNKACINIIEEFINLSKKIDKEKLKTLAKMFV